MAHKREQFELFFADEKFPQRSMVSRSVLILSAMHVRASPVSGVWRVNEVNLKSTSHKYAARLTWTHIGASPMTSKNHTWQWHWPIGPNPFEHMLTVGLDHFCHSRWLCDRNRNWNTLWNGLDRTAGLTANILGAKSTEFKKNWLKISPNTRVGKHFVNKTLKRDTRKKKRTGTYRSVVDITVSPSHSRAVHVDRLYEYVHTAQCISLYDTAARQCTCPYTIRALPIHSHRQTASQTHLPAKGDIENCDEEAMKLVVHWFLHICSISCLNFVYALCVCDVFMYIFSIKIDSPTISVGCKKSNKAKSGEKISQGCAASQAHIFSCCSLSAVSFHR